MRYSCKNARRDTPLDPIGSSPAVARRFAFSCPRSPSGCAVDDGSSHRGRSSIPHVLESIPAGNRQLSRLPANCLHHEPDCVIPHSLLASRIWQPNCGHPTDANMVCKRDGSGAHPANARCVPQRQGATEPEHVVQLKEWNGADGNGRHRRVDPSCRCLVPHHCIPSWTNLGGVQHGWKRRRATCPSPT